MVPVMLNPATRLTHSAQTYQVMKICVGSDVDIVGVNMCVCVSTHCAKEDDGHQVFVATDDFVQ